VSHICHRLERKKVQGNYIELSYRSRTTTVMDSKTRELITIKYTKAIKRIGIVKKFHEYFPAVHIHNHYRQGSLAFERKWKTKRFSLRFFMSLLGVCITNAFLMYDLEYKRSSSSISGVGSSEKKKLDFTNFLDSLAYLMIFSDARDAFKSKKRKNEGKSNLSKGGEVGGEHHVHELLPHTEFRRNCSICKRQVKFYCRTCSTLKSAVEGEQPDDVENIIWLCSPVPSNKGVDGHVSRQCYATHI
jgi:hypothetical protein